MIIYNLWSTRKPIVQQDKNICWFWRFFPIYLLSFFNLLKKTFRLFLLRFFKEPVFESWCSSFLQYTYTTHDTVAYNHYLRQFRSVYPPNIYSPTLTKVTVGPRPLHCEWNVLELHPWSVAR